MYANYKYVFILFFYPLYMVLLPFERFPISFPTKSKLLGRTKVIPISRQPVNIQQKQWSAYFFCEFKERGSLQLYCSVLITSFCNYSQLEHNILQWKICIEYISFGSNCLYSQQTSRTLDCSFASCLSLLDELINPGVSGQCHPVGKTRNKGEVLSSGCSEVVYKDNWF